MLTVENVFYSKNCFKIKVSKDGHYIIANKLYPLKSGEYVIHDSYDFIRNLKIGDNFDCLPQIKDPAKGVDKKNKKSNTPSPKPKQKKVQKPKSKKSA